MSTAATPTFKSAADRGTGADTAAASRTAASNLNRMLRWIVTPPAPRTNRRSQREPGPEEQRVAPPQGLALRPLLRPDIVDPEQFVLVRCQGAGKVAEIRLPFVK